MPSLLPSDRPSTRRRRAGWVEPDLIYQALGSEGSSRFWLDSGVHAETGMSYLGVVDTVLTTDAAGEVTWHPSGAVERAPILDVLRRELAAETLHLGWVGWLGYGIGVQTTGIPLAVGRRYPDAAFLRVERMVVVDHRLRTIDLITADPDPRAASAWFDTLELAIEHSARAQPPDEPPTVSPTHVSSPAWRHSDALYLQAIEQCQRAIIEGEAYQLCLTTEVTVDGAFDAVAAFLSLRRLSPTRHGGIIELRGSPDLPALSLVSSSPESFLEVTPDGVVSTSPIKGTRPRSSDADLDSARADELRSSVKEQAENLMIVDLMRNDLGRVCEIGSVSVPALFEIQSYAQVHQLVSRVEGRLAAGRDALDVVASCFPAGSMTGAPKFSAMGLLDSIESRPRGVYAGAFGYLGVDGSVDLAMVIRSILIDERGATIGTGGGITALSEPLEELAEVKLKASALLRALGLE